jgi:hypothetical protein
MEEKFICDKKYVFHKTKRTIYLPVKLESLPENLVIGGHELLERSEFHVSLVCIGKIAEKFNISIPNFDDKIVEDFCEFAKTKEIKLLGYKDEFRFVERENRKTVVVMCKMLNLDEFFNFINKKYSLEIESPPAHVTLYTLDGEAGIFLISADDIKNFTVPIPNPLGHSL